MKLFLSASMTVCITMSALFAAPNVYSAEPEKIIWKELRDLDFGNTLYYFFQRQYFSSIVQLTVAQQKETIPHHKQEAELLLGGMYLSFGMHKESGEIFERLIDAKIPVHIRNKAWFFLAKIRYQRNLFPEAEQAIKHIEGRLTDRDDEKRLLFANILMAQQRYQDADAYLQDTKEQSVWSYYIRYNLAVSIIKQGNIDRGHEILTSIGTIRSQDKELLSIRDQANLALGYSFIQQNKPEYALPYLRKVRLNGLVSNKALLGLGWAYDQQKEYKKALVPWLVLNKRNLLDSSVQESFLATAYALGKLDKDALALRHYNDTIEIYESEIRRLEDTIINIRGGEFIRQIMDEQTQNEMGWFWEMKEAPKVAESSYLISFLASNTFQESLKNYRDLRLMKSNLDTWSHNMDVYHTILETRRLAYQERYPIIQKHTLRINNGDLQQQRDQFYEEYNQTILKDDILALANSAEKQHLKKLDQVRHRIEKLSPHRNVDKAKEKYRLALGIIKWNISSQYGPRTWAIKKGFIDLDKALIKNKQRALSIGSAEKNAPFSYEGYNNRIQLFSIQIQNLLDKATATLNEQEQLLKSLAIYELRKQQDRISSYLTHAQFSVAQIQDRAAHNKKQEEQP
ncbi:MAG: tetratricopeptide repeat protein [Gammaproteobacteria bacterium]|nr:tetratricopeptide repeat protein [Gammaproteobacteria bacterium]